MELILIEGTWYERNDEYIELFGTDLIPTAYREGTSREEVEKAIG